MNPLASAKCAQRLLMALAAASALMFLAACSSSSSTSVNKQGFSNTSLSGTYVFSSQGFDSANGDPDCHRRRFHGQRQQQQPLHHWWHGRHRRPRIFVSHPSNCGPVGYVRLLLCQ